MDGVHSVWRTSQEQSAHAITITMMEKQSTVVSMQLDAWLHLEKWSRTEPKDN